MIFEPHMRDFSFVGQLEVFNFDTYVLFQSHKKHLRCALKGMIK